MLCSKMIVAQRDALKAAIDVINGLPVIPVSFDQRDIETEYTDEAASHLKAAFDALNNLVTKSHNDLFNLLTDQKGWQDNHAQYEANEKYPLIKELN